jgi:hypothetical protein
MRARNETLSNTAMGEIRDTLVELRRGIDEVVARDSNIINLKRAN